MTPLERFIADHKFILSAVGDAAGIKEPVAVDLDEFLNPILGKARRGPVLPLDGVLIRDWAPDSRKYWPGLRFGVRLYDLDGIRFARAYAGVSDNVHSHGYDFVAVGRADYGQFYKLALKYRKTANPPGPPPVLPAGVADILRENTIDYLDRKNLARIKAYGGRPKRGILLAGPPGNGKTSACRWIWQQCLDRGYEYRFVSPDDYRAARNQRDPAEAVRRLFQFDRPGVVFFDDMDIALRNRDQGYESDDQAVFLGALDGITTTEGVVHVFTTNCRLDLIDPAFRRPGRIDVILTIPLPDEPLRRELVRRWHPEAQAGIDETLVVADTAGLSFAEIEELRNLLVMRFLNKGSWDWNWARAQFAANRTQVNRTRLLGFAAAPQNGACHSVN